MILLLCVTSACICVGVTVAALANLPLYWGFLAGWLGPSVVIVIVMLPRVILSGITIVAQRRKDKTIVFPWHEQRGSEG